MARRAILIVKLAAVGDIVMTSSLARRLRAEAEDAHIAWLCGRTGAEIVDLFGVDEVIAVDEVALMRGGPAARGAALARLLWRLAGRRFDEVYVCHTDRRYRALLASVRARRVVMLDRDAPGAPIPIRGRYFADEYARMPDAGYSAGPIARRFDIADARAQFPVRSEHLPAGDRPVVALVPGGAKNVLRETPLRRWPVERYVELATRVIADGCQLVLVGDAHDAWVLEHFAGLAVTSLVGVTSLRETVGALRWCDLVVTHDTGPMHLARLVRAPLVALFGPTSPREFAGDAAHVSILWGGEHLACRPCYDGHDLATCANNLCMKSISVDDAYRQARLVLDGGRSVSWA